MYISLKFYDKKKYRKENMLMCNVDSNELC